MKVLIVINDGKFFLSHRYALAKGLQQNGYNVIVACPEGSAIAEIQAAGFQVHPIVISRRGLNPFSEIKLLLSLFLLYKKIDPDIIHHFSIKPIIYGSIASRFLDKPIVINAPTGLGYLFSSEEKKAKRLKKFVLHFYRFALKHSKSYLIFQNPDDRDLFTHLNLSVGKKTFLVKGAGIDPSIYIPSPEVQGDPIVIFPGRLLIDKGVYEFVEAATILKKQGIKARFALVGDIDPGNPATVSSDTIKTWEKSNLIECWGRQEDMLSIFQKSHIVCLPSYREGIPKALLEAAACEKPIVTTNAPGCREVVIDHHNGFLVPIKDSKTLSERLKTLIQDSSLRTRMGKSGRIRVKSEFSAEKIIQETLAAYEECIQNFYPSKKQIVM